MRTILFIELAEQTADELVDPSVVSSPPNRLAHSQQSQHVAPAGTMWSDGWQERVGEPEKQQLVAELGSQAWV